jgi:4-hydroxy-2-oxoheptanedioate aldolase
MNRAPFRIDLAEAKRPLIGMWLETGSPLVAEICAGSGVDWVLIDAEHGPNDLTTILHQLQALAAYPVATLVRPPIGEPIVIKQYLDIGVQNLLIPMCESAEHATEMVRAVRYPPRGIRGVGSLLARSSQWNRIEDYATTADDSISLILQVETTAGVAAVDEILAVDGVDGIYLGPADLAASMGHPGEREHPDVVAAIEHCLARATEAGKSAGVNTFVPAMIERYIGGGASFVGVGADVTLLARGSDELAQRYTGSGDR